MDTQLKTVQFDVGTVLRDQREKANLTQSQLARDAEVSQNKIHRMETLSGNFDRSLEAFWRVCLAMGKDPVEVLKTSIQGKAGCI